MARPKRTKFYFSLRSPYSWLAYRDLFEHYTDVVDQLEWIPFWEPDKITAALLAGQDVELPYADMSRAKNLYILQDVGRIAKARNIALSWPIDRDPVWEIPHLGYLVARSAGRGRDYIALVYRARWEDGRDICDRSTIGDIGAELGLSRTEMANASDSDDLRAEGVRILRDVRDDGVFGVPFFLHGRSRFWGVDRLPQFVAQLREAQPPVAVPAPGSGTGPSFDDGHAGGCG